MRRAIAYVAMVVVIGGLSAGCDWTKTGTDESWNDRFSWINFSGLYSNEGLSVVRPAEPPPPDAPAPTPVPVPVPGQDQDYTVIVNNEYAGIAPAFQTSLTGVINFRPGIIPGSITIVLAMTPGGLSSGTATDNGGGELSGAFNLVGLDPTSAYPMSGTINYTTGAWTLDLTSPGLLTDAEIYISYAYDSSIATGGGNVVDPPTDPTDPGTVTPPPYISIISIRVEQIGNKLRFTDSRNGYYEGIVTTVTAGGGDLSGRTSGTVEMMFEAAGLTHDGRQIQIMGSFMGAYLAPTSEQESQMTGVISREYGQLQDRVIQGIWIEPDGSTASIYGRGGTLEVTIPTPIIAPVQD